MVYIEVIWEIAEYTSPLGSPNSIPVAKEIPSLDILVTKISAMTGA